MIRVVIYCFTKKLKLQRMRSRKIKDQQIFFYKLKIFLNLRENEHAIVREWSSIVLSKYYLLTGNLGLRVECSKLERRSFNTSDERMNRARLFIHKNKPREKWKKKIK